MKTTRLLSLIFGFSIALQSHAILITFDEATDYTSLFNATDSDALSWSSANGVGGTSGRVGVPQSTATSDTTAVYNQTSFDLTTGDTFETSIYFLIPDPIGGNAFITAAQIGFTSENNQGFLNNSGFAYISSRVRANATGDTYILESQFKNPTDGATNVDTTGTFNLSVDNWYKLTATYTDVGSSFDYTATVQNFGTDGITTGSVVESISGNMAQTSLSGTDTTAWAAFRSNGHVSENKVLALDNFAVIPEPGTLVILGFALTTLAVFRRR
ncbi:MAG: PEP-CTERM sorting domain-containing protein [Opitutales bacterium]